MRLQNLPASLSPSHQVFVILCAVFVTALIVANIAGGKLFLIGPFHIPLGWLPWVGIQTLIIPSRILPTGIIPFPITFLLTDLINEFYGKKGATFVTLVGLAMSLFTYLILIIAIQLPASSQSPLDDITFQQAFGMSNRLILASLTAYVIGQLLDIQIFHLFRSVTKEKLLWLRATGSTVCSQLVDSLVVTFISFGATLAFSDVLGIALNSYIIKFIVAVALTPLLYVGHAVVYGMIESRIQSKSHQQVIAEEDEPDVVTL